MQQLLCQRVCGRPITWIDPDRVVTIVLFTSLSLYDSHTHCTIGLKRTCSMLCLYLCNSVCRGWYRRFSSFFSKTRPNETEEFNKATKNKLCLKQLFHLSLCPRGDDCPAVARLSTEIFQLLYNKCVIMYYFCCWCWCCFCYELHIMFFVYFYYFFKFIIFSSGDLMSYTESSRQIFNLFHIFLLLRSLHLAGGG